MHREGGRGPSPGSRACSQAREARRKPRPQALGTAARPAMPALRPGRRPRPGRPQWCFFRNSRLFPHFPPSGLSMHRSQRFAFVEARSGRAAVCTLQPRAARRRVRAEFGSSVAQGPGCSADRCAYRRAIARFCMRLGTARRAMIASGKANHGWWAPDPGIRVLDAARCAGVARSRRRTGRRPRRSPCPRAVRAGAHHRCRQARRLQVHLQAYIAAPAGSRSTCRAYGRAVEGRRPVRLRPRRQEQEAAARAGVRCEVINGITAGVAAAGAARVPLTHRACRGVRSSSPAIRRMASPRPTGRRSSPRA